MCDLDLTISIIYNYPEPPNASLGLQCKCRAESKIVGGKSPHQAAQWFKHLFEGRLIFVAKTIRYMYSCIIEL